RFDILGACNIFGWNKDLKKEIAEIVFQGEESQNYIEGKYDTLMFTKTLIKRYPKRRKEINEVFTDEFLRTLMLPNEDTYDLLKELSQHYNVYILSNLYTFMLKRFNEMFGDIDNYIKGSMFSCDVKMKKPDPKIFDLFLHRFNLNPAETAFIDDTKENIIAATSKDIGIKVGIHYKWPDETNLKIYLLLLKDLQANKETDEKKRKEMLEIEKV
ncbi:MAG: HAD-IA family hydrolase, partial [Clostridia bacterium]|nr:HAD-IA family hydrolase [Clostridia bacterium]